MVSIPPQYGGALCSNLVAEQRECFVARCNDCEDVANGPNGLPCFNGGECVDGTAYDGTFTCLCAATFSGDNCQFRIGGDCDQESNGPNSKGCGSLGTCVDEIELDGSFTCDCEQAGLTGDNCELGLY
jgi:hypothetical protein